MVNRNTTQRKLPVTVRFNVDLQQEVSLDGRGERAQEKGIDRLVDRAYAEKKKKSFSQWGPTVGRESDDDTKSGVERSSTVRSI